MKITRHGKTNKYLIKIPQAVSTKNLFTVYNFGGLTHATILLISTYSRVPPYQPYYYIQRLCRKNDIFSVSDEFFYLNIKIFELQHYYYLT